MKKAIGLSCLLAMILTMLCIGSVSIASAETSSYYTYTVSNDQATITSISTSVSGAITIPSTLGGYPVVAIAGSACKGRAELTSVVIPNSVTSIGAYAFSNCDALQSVKMGTGMKTVSDFAFANCDYLKSVDLGETTYIGTAAFYNCPMLNTVDFGSSLETIAYSGGWNGTDYGQGAFEGCTALASVTLPNTTKSIGGTTFENCSRLERVSLGTGLTTIGGDAFNNCDKLKSIVIPDSVTNMGSYAFYDCDALESVTIGSGLSNIPEFAFAECGYLESLELSNTKQIYEAAFYNCVMLNSVEWGESLEVIWGNTEWNGRHYGKGAFEACEALPSVTIPDTVTTIGTQAFMNCVGMRYITLGENVTALGASAFKNCSTATRITLNEKLATIGTSAFENCAKVYTIDIPDSVVSMGDYAFYSCDAMETLTIGSGLDVISRYAFADCPCLETADLGSVEEINTAAFYNCSVLEEVDFGESLVAINYSGDWDGRAYGQGAFEECVALRSVTIPNTTISIGDTTFYNCDRLATVTLGNSLDAIGGDAFYDCDVLTSIVIPNSVTQMGWYTFYSCDALQSVQIGNGLDVLPAYAFAQCPALTTLALGDVDEIQTAAFYNCTALRTVDWGTALKKLTCSTDWNGRHYGTGVFENCTSLTSLAIPNTATEIGQNSFKNCTGLTRVTVGNKVITIGASAFRDCTGITTVTLDEKLVTIGGSAFENCAKLQSIVIPDSVTSLGSYAFYNCQALKSASIGEATDVISSFAFAQCPNLERVTLTGTTSIDTAAFYNCTSLHDLDLGTGLRTITSSTGWDGRNYGKGAFQNCTALTALTFPSRVTSIASNAFNGCTGVVYVYFCDKLQTIENSAFVGCSAVTDVFYEGTASEWGYVSVGTGNDPITNATMHYGATPVVTYTVFYHANGGTDAPAAQLKIGGTALTLSEQVPTREKCSFAGWATTPGATTAQYQPGARFTTDANTTLYAVWTKSEYTISYNGNGGSGIPNQQIKIPGTPLKLSTQIPRRTGYAFVGWATSSKATAAEYQPGTQFKNNKDTTLFAVWLKDAYRVTFSGNGGSGVPNPQFKIIGTPLTLSAQVPTRSGYAFVGWSTSSSAATAGYQPGDAFKNNSTTTLYAVWQKGAYRISYDANGGTGAPAAQIKVPGTALKLSTTKPTRSGYKFLGWATSKTATAGEYATGASFKNNTTTTLYAVWKKDQYKISYNGNGGSGVPNQQTKIPGTPLKLSTQIPKRSGYAFVGWATSSKATAAEYQPGGQFKNNQDTTLFAVWQKDAYRVTFAGNGGSSVPNAQIKVKGTALKLSTQVPVRSGYAFVGWSTSSTATTADYQPGGQFKNNATTTLYAVWMKDAYRITFAGNGGSSVPNAQIKVKGTALKLSTQVPTRSGYAFVGWSTSSSAATAAYQPGDLFKNNSTTTLYAVWQKGAYRITYDANGGSGAPAAQIKVPGTALKLSTTRPTRAGYKFLGWATSKTASAGEYATGASFKINATTTLYAVWKKEGSSLTAGQSYNASITVGGQEAVYTFTPTSSGTYTIYSTSTEDTRVNLYNASGTLLSSDDDGGDGYNFRLTYSFKEGVTYKFGVRFFGTTRTGTLPFTLEKA